MIIYDHIQLYPQMMMNIYDNTLQNYTELAMCRFLVLIKAPQQWA